MRKAVVAILLTLIPLSLFAETFVEGKDYQLLPQTAITSPTHGKEVIEFFSFGCPWCYKLESKVQDWRKTLPKDVAFTRVPVVFERGWDIYAKAYYTAKTLNILDKMTPKIFAAIQEKNQKLDSSKAMIKFFTDNGVKEKLAESAFTSSAAIDAQVKQGMQLMQRFGIYSVPTLVVNHKYRVDLQLAKGDESRMFAIVSYLVSK